MTTALASGGVQYGTVTVNSGSTTGSATINAMGSGGFLLWNGQTASQAGASLAQSSCALSLSSATITSTRQTGGANTVTTSFCAVDGDPTNFIKSVQYGSVSFVGGSSTGNATISAVTTGNTAVAHNGMFGTATGTSLNLSWPVWTVSSATAIAMTTNTSGGTLTGRFCAIEFQSAALSSLQTVTDTAAPSTTTRAHALAAVTLANTFTIYGGQWSSSTTAASFRQYSNITSTTSMTIGTQTAGFISIEYCAYVVNLNSALVETGAQRGTMSFSAATTQSAVVSSVNTAHAITTNTGNSTNGSNWNVITGTNTLASGTSITGAFNAANTGLMGYEVLALNPAAAAGSVATAAGTSTAAAVASSTAESTGASAGTSTAQATGKSTVAAVGAAAGTSTAQATAIAAVLAVGSSTGASTAQATSALQAKSVGSSTGASTAQATGSSQTAAVASSTGSSTAQATAASQVAAIGSAAGTSTAQASAQAGTAATGTAAGTSTAQATSAVQAKSTGASTGSSTAQAVAASQVAAVGSSTGSSTAQALAASIAASIASSTGASTAQASSLTGSSAVGNATGSSTAQASGASTVAAVGNAAGTSTAQGVGATGGQSLAVGNAAGTSTAQGVGAFTIVALPDQNATGSVIYRTIKSKYHKKPYHIDWDAINERQREDLKKKITELFIPPEPEEMAADNVVEIFDGGERIAKIINDNKKPNHHELEILLLMAA